MSSSVDYSYSGMTCFKAYLVGLDTCRLLSSFYFSRRISSTKCWMSSLDFSKGSVFKLELSDADEDEDDDESEDEEFD